MHAPIDEATSQFLEAAADDLQRQLSLAGVVERIETKPSPVGTMIVATIRVGRQTTEVMGYGDSLLTAHADLRERVAVPTVRAALRDLFDP